MLKSYFIYNDIEVTNFAVTVMSDVIMFRRGRGERKRRGGGGCGFWGGGGIHRVSRLYDAF